MNLFLQFLFAFAATAGFCFIFNVPRRHILAASLAGALGWLLFRVLLMNGESSVTACFFGSCLVALVSDVFARLFKDAATLFIIPGILPLVPGAGMYNTMLAFLNHDFQKMAAVGTETLMMAGSIAIAILLVASFSKILAAAKQGLQKLPH